MSVQRSHYVFDAYGTLFDVHAATARYAAEIGPAWERLSHLWRTKQLEYSWVTALTGRHRSFWALTEESLDFAAAVVGGLSPRVRAELLDAYRRLDCYPEVGEVLAGLRAGGARTAVLTNGDPEMIADAVASAGLGHLLDHLITVHEVSSYKTAPLVYAHAAHRLGAEPDHISFQSSNRWDIAGARAFGYGRCVWVNRTGQPDEYPDLAPDSVVRDLRGLLGTAEG